MGTKVTILTDDQVKKKIAIQSANIKEFDDVFKKLEEIKNLPYPNSSESQGALKACMIIQNYLLNRERK